MAEGQFRYRPDFSEPRRKGSQFSKSEFEHGSELLTKRAKLYAAEHNIPFEKAVKLVAERDGLQDLI